MENISIGIIFFGGVAGNTVIAFHIDFGFVRWYGHMNSFIVCLIRDTSLLSLSKNLILFLLLLKLG